MDWHAWIGQGEDLTPLQMGLRAVITFIICLILIRLGGARIFGRRSGMDTVIMIVMGSVLARGVVGASPILSTWAAAFMMILLHRVFSWISSRSPWFETLLKGRSHEIYSNGKIIDHELRQASLSRSDLMESLRLETQEETLENVQSARLETNGRISFRKKS